MTQTGQNSAHEVPPQLPLEGALGIANDEHSPLKGTFAGNVISDLADTAKLATRPLKYSAEGTRDHIQENAPNWMLNNSARLIAGAHILGELSYMVSGGTFPSPIKIEGFGTDGYGGKYKSPFDAEGWENGFKELGKAFERSKGLETIKALPYAEQKAAGGMAYGKWRTYSALTGLTMFGLSALLNPAPESEEEESRLKEKYETDKLGYLAERTGQIFRPDKHARQAMGLGFLAVGLFSGICGLKQRQFYNAGIEGVSSGYMKEVYAAGLSALSGAALIYSTEDQKGWQRLGQIMPTRLIFTLPRSFEVWKDKKDLFYGGGVAAFQLMNGLSYTIGGTSGRLNDRHSAFARLGGMEELPDNSWREKPTYQKYHEQADAIKGEYAKRRNIIDTEHLNPALNHEDNTVENHADKAGMEHSDKTETAAKDASNEAPKTEVHDAQETERLAHTASQQVA